MATERGSAPEAGALVSEPWMAFGSCRGMDPEFFFPTDGAGVVQARRVCAQCNVREQCLQFALDHRIDHGVWGGASERARRRLLSQQLSSVRAPLRDV
ncbi:transcription factor WhiB [Acidimicrobium ferrooxidans DSM 10331]|uniref:Transcriptional regulator WhiB n=1 Tax=Acidimicrobium ferrooxidans (strain DSM 10331 / JCM 15462 / NBRC 103882 / ICP) TaxID=525909 RepID=C7M2Q2_ACIFD|nr:WhiB family transcriptional regulator [Acidimicrobium ferrooxidans]ACU53296.1 transcription factor WhiB [Acidimicrobium ferrooxidans DSM 10331]